MPTIATIHAEQRVNTSTAGLQTAPAVATLADGSYVVVWQDETSTNIRAQRFDASGDKLGDEFRVNSTTANAQSDPAVIGLKGGGFVIAWTTVPDAASPIFKDVLSQLFDATGDKVGGEQQNPGGPWPGPHTSASVSALEDGGYVVTINDHQLDVDTPDPDVYGHRYDAAGKLVGEPFLVNAPSSLEERNPSSAGLKDGGLVVVWDLQIDSIHTGKIFVQRLDADGEKVGGEVLLSETAGYLASSGRSVAGLADGGYVVLWKAEESRELFAQRFAASGAKVGSPIEIGMNTDGSHSSPSVVGLPDGGFAVTWLSRQYFGGGSPDDGVHLQRFSATGARVGSEALISPDVHEGGVGYFQEMPALAALDDGRVVVAWVNAEEDVIQQVIGPSVEGATLSAATEIASGGARDDTFLAAPDALNDGDLIYGEGGSDQLRLTSAGEADLTDVFLKSVEKILGSKGDDAFVVDDAVLAGVTLIDGAGGDDTVVTGEATLDLVGLKLVKVEHIATTHAAGTNFVVDSVAEALLVDGAGLHDTVTATTLTFGARQRSQMFANGVEEIVDASGRYLASSGDLLLA
ncbi:hypothetical protein [Phenylobacterium deserti]|uniref:Calcium-binding protein n=1 Tax=Phenylobacterium deserti TaxID=1914756 RepID=A0A328ARK8_9CAUL|nr:hypothetical protein [Phenylobacterium deserti]RAK57277.1 hypothetical protein DJ018_04840 [Phenylobacterium deserti]